MAKTDSLHGTLDLLVLKVLSRGTPLTGYAISQEIKRQEIKKDPLKKLSVWNGSLYPALRQMRRAGWISSHWTFESRRSCLWTITKEGMAQFSEKYVDWLAFRSAVDRFLRRR